jgi:hypothetical protein
MTTINLTDDELAAVTAAIRRAIEDDRFPHAPRPAPRSAARGTREARRGLTMVQIAISQSAFDAIMASMQLGSVGSENATDEQGQRLIWLEPQVLASLRALRWPSEARSTAT